MHMAKTTKVIHVFLSLINITSVRVASGTGTILRDSVSTADVTFFVDGDFYKAIGRIHRRP